MNAGFRVARRTVCVLVVAVMTVLVSTTTSQAASVRVPEDFFGINLSGIGFNPDTINKNLDGIASVGLGHVRFPAPWYDIEPSKPQGTHVYNWPPLDRRIRALAVRGLHAQPIIGLPPGWATQPGLNYTYCKSIGAPATRPYDAGAWGAMARAVTVRYGPGGAFWDENPSLPYRPVERWEISNEPNIIAFWCPGPQPEVYGELFHRAAQQIRGVDPHAELILGGLAPVVSDAKSQYMRPSTFLKRLVRWKPVVLSEADAIGAHVFPFQSIDVQLNILDWFRDEMQAGEIPNSMPMQVNEIGWPTQGQGASPESLRAQRFARFATEASRTNCNVSGMFAHQWVSPEQNGSAPEQWFGIANHVTGVPYPSAYAFADATKLMRGALAAEPPTAAIETCDGMPLPDQDGDGFVDEADYYPLDPSLPGGEPPEAPPGKEQPGGDDPSGGGSSTSATNQDLIGWLLDQLR